MSFPSSPLRKMLPQAGPEIWSLPFMPWIRTGVTPCHEMTSSPSVRLMTMMLLKSEVATPPTIEASGSGTSGAAGADAALGSFSSSGSLAMACGLDRWISVFMGPSYKNWFQRLPLNPFAYYRALQESLTRRILQSEKDTGDFQRGRAGLKRRIGVSSAGLPRSVGTEIMISNTRRGFLAARTE